MVKLQIQFSEPPICFFSVKLNSKFIKCVLAIITHQQPVSHHFVILKITFYRNLNESHLVSFFVGNADHEQQLLGEDRWLYEFPKQFPIEQPEDCLIAADPLQNELLYADLTQLAGIEPVMIMNPAVEGIDNNLSTVIATPSLNPSSLNDQTANIRNWLSDCSTGHNGESSANEDAAHSVKTHSSSSTHSRSTPNTGHQRKDQSQHHDDVDISQISKDELKRLKNTEAARQSRKRKFEHTKTLEMQRDHLDARNRQLERDNAVLLSQADGYVQRISSLEKQISDLHAVLAAFGMKLTQQPQQQLSPTFSRVPSVMIQKEKLNT